MNFVMGAEDVGEVGRSDYFIGVAQEPGSRQGYIIRSNNFLSDRYWDDIPLYVSTFGKLVVVVWLLDERGETVCVPSTEWIRARFDDGCPNYKARYIDTLRELSQEQVLKVMELAEVLFRGWEEA